jgi:hypothetical protein
MQGHEVRYNYGVPKHACTNRAEWRLQPGKPAQHLSAYYQLDCEYGTALMICWKDGGSEPIYACETHANELGRSGGTSAGVRKTTGEKTDGNKSIVKENRTEPREAASTKPKLSAPLETVPSLADTKPGPGVTDPPVAATARDVTYGNSAKALVDEGIGDIPRGDRQVYRTALQNGKFPAEAAEAAGGQFAAVYRKISEYTPKLENILSESKATINAAEAIDKPLEDAVLEIIGNGAMSDAEKDTAIQLLGALQKWIKRSLHGDLTPLEANRIERAIGDRVNWGGNTGVSEELKPAYRALYGRLKSAVHTAVPEAQDLDERLANLYAVKSDLENLPKARELKPLLA